MPPEGLPRPEEMWSGDVADASDDSHPISERTEEFEGRVWSVVRDRVGFGHHEATRDVIIHPGAVAVIAIDDEDRILLIRQYRHPVAMYMFEPPAGLLDTAGELPLETAKRELAEEAGVRASQWNVLVDLFNSPGGSITAGMVIYDTMQLIPNDVATVAMGLAASMGQFLLSAGTKGKRKIGKNCRVMIHNVAAGNFGNLPNLANELEAIQRLQEDYISAMVENTKFTRKKLQKLLNEKVNIYLDAEEAVRYGLADEIM